MEVKEVCSSGQLTFAEIESEDIWLLKSSQREWTELSQGKNQIMQQRWPLSLVPCLFLSYLFPLFSPTWFVWHTVRLAVYLSSKDFKTCHHVLNPISIYLYLISFPYMRMQRLGCIIVSESTVRETDSPVRVKPRRRTFDHGDGCTHFKGLKRSRWPLPWCYAEPIWLREKL